MKKLLLSLLLLTSLRLFGQTVPDVNRTIPVPLTGSNANNRATWDANLYAYKNLRIPRGASFTLNGAKDSIGYIMFNTTSNRLGVYRGGGVWDTYTIRADYSAVSPLLYNSSTGTLTIQQATTSQPGYLSFADWNTFNGKQSALSGTGYARQAGATTNYDSPATVLSTINGQSKIVTNVNDYTTPNGSTNNTSGIVAAIAATPDGGTVFFPGTGKYVINQVLVYNRNINIDFGSSVFLLKGDTAGFAIRGNTHAMNIHGFGAVMVGDSVNRDTNTKKGQVGILINSNGYGYGPAPSGMTNITVSGIKVIGTNRGFEASLSSGPLHPFADTLMSHITFINCRATKIVGVVSGAGYGFVLSNIVNSTITNCFTDSCQRHGIYLANGKGYTVNATHLSYNRAKVHNGSLKPALSISRSKKVAITGNTFENNYDASIVIDQDTLQTGLDTKINGVEVIGNVFKDNTGADLAVGTTGSADGIPANIDFSHNTIIRTKTSANSAILINQANRLSMTHNTIDDASGALRCITFAGIGGAANTKNIYANDNIINYKGDYIFQIPASITSGTDTIEIRNNKVKSNVATFEFLGGARNISNVNAAFVDGRNGVIANTDLGTTPNVGGMDVITLNNSSATTITNFLGGTEGQRLVCYFGDNNTTLSHTNLYLAGAVNYTGTTNGTMTMVYTGGFWREVARSGGVMTATSFVKSGATAGNLLTAGGSDIPQSTFAPAAQGISSASIVWPGTLYTTPTTGVMSGNALTFSPALANQVAKSWFGNATSGSTTPSFNTSPVPVLMGGTGVTTSTGSGSVVLSTSPTLTTPNLGTPSTLVGTNITGTASGLVAGGVSITGTSVNSGYAMAFLNGNNVSYNVSFTYNPSTSLLTVPGPVESNGVLIVGNPTAPPGTAQALTEGYYGTGGYAFFQGYNYNTSAYIPTHIDGSTVSINSSSAGAVLVNTTTDSGNGEKLQVNGRVSGSDPTQNTDFVTKQYGVANYAPLASPTFTGTATLPNFVIDANGLTGGGGSSSPNVLFLAKGTYANPSVTGSDFQSSSTIYATSTNSNNFKGATLTPNIGALNTGNLTGIFAGLVVQPATTAGATGTLTRADGVRSVLQLAAPGMTVTYATALFGFINATGPVTNSTNLLLGTQTPVTGNYSIYSASTWDSYFAGSLVGSSIRGTAVVFASLPASPVEGMLVTVTDSNTNTIGATIAGGGANHVLAYYNGTNWTVTGK